MTGKDRTVYWLWGLIGPVANRFSQLLRRFADSLKPRVSGLRWPVYRLNYIYGTLFIVHTPGIFPTKTMTELAAQLLESSQAPKIIQQVQAILNEEQNRRRAFYEWMDEDMKTEFINGEIVVHSPALHRHNAAVMALGTLLDLFVSQQQVGIVVVEKSLVELTRNSYEPDLCYFGPEKAATLAPELLYYPAPDLVFEVLSESTKKNDREVKFEDYAAHGVTEYWIIDPKRQTIETFTIDADTEAYAETGLFKIGQSVSSAVLPNFTIPVKAIFDSAAKAEAIRSLLS